MKTASNVIFETFEKKFREPILQAQNMAIVTGEAINPVLDELLKVADKLVMLSKISLIGLTGQGKGDKK